MRTELIFSKKHQLQKNKPKNDKKLPSKELQQYQFWLKENHPQCQAKLNGCEHQTIEAHHVLFGSFGADKDDTRLISVCRACHCWCHAHKKLSQELLLHVAEFNWMQYTKFKS